MRSPESIQVSLGRKSYDGEYEIQTVTTDVFYEDIPSGETANHEAEHSVVAEEDNATVEMASIVPGPGYLGITKLSRFSAAAAVAPHANGRYGTGHDLAVTQQMRADIGTAIGTAKSIIMRRQRQIRAVAGALETHRTLSGGEIRKVMDSVDRGVEMTVFVRNTKTGEEQETKSIRSTEKDLIIEKEWYPPREAA